MDTHNDPYKIYTREEAAAFLRINPSYLTKISQSGELHSMRMGRRRVYPRASLEAYIRGERGPRFDADDIETGTPSMLSEEDMSRDSGTD